MKIEIWSDIYCPFCYIGEKHLKAALKQYPQGDQVELVYKSYELDPNLEVGVGHDTATYVAEKYRISPEQAKQNYQGIQEAGRAVGLEMDFESAIITNTFDGHRLIHWANQEGKMTEMVDRLFKAHFEDGLDVGNHEVLADLAQEIGLDRMEALEVLASSRFADQVRADELEGQALGITSVPYFVFNRELAVMGAQPTAVFEEAIEQAFGIKKGFKTLSSDAGMVCGPDGCRIG